MNGNKKYLLDTNTVIDLMGGNLPNKSTRWLNNEVINQTLCISIINKIEILGFNATQEEMNYLNRFVNAIEILPLSDEVADKTIQLRKQKKIKLPDAIIAATAIIYDITLISRNFDDFKNIQGLKFQDSFRI